MSRDDEENIGPLSGTHALERADHRKSEKRAERVKKEQKNDLQKLKREMLLKNVQKQQAPPSKNDEKKTFGPQTHLEQEQEEKTADAEKQPKADAFMKKEEEKQAIKKLTPYEQQQNAG